MEPIKIDFGSHEEVLALARAIADLGQRMRLLESEVGDQTEAFEKLESASDVSTTALEKVAENLRTLAKRDEVTPIAERVSTVAEQADAAIRGIADRLDAFESKLVAARNEHAALFGNDDGERVELARKQAERADGIAAAVAELRGELEKQSGGVRQLEALARGFNPRGKWDDGTAYSRLDVVVFNGSSFVSQEDGNRERPGRGSKKWMLLAARGASGGEVNLSTASGTLGVAQGGTGATSAADARTNLGLGTIATQNANAVTLTGGSITGISTLTTTGDATFGGDASVSKTNSAAWLIANSAAGQYRGMYVQTAGSARWILGSSNAAESGANAGSNLVIISYDDSGNYVGTPVQISRATGAITFTGPINIPNTTDATTSASGALVVSGGVGVAKNLYVGGSFKLSGDTAWEDLRFPAQAINPPGVTASPTRNENTGLLEFSGTVDNIIAGVAQMPHSWKAGTAVEPHIHLLFPTSASANTRWKFEHNVIPLGGNAALTYGQYTSLSVITVANPQNVKSHTYGDFASISMTGAPESSCILWRLSRLANSDAGDTDTNAVVFMELDLHYEVEKLGSDNESPI